ncbi:hypothetical protein PO909_001451 [Leuciscus waleckii]
MVWFTTEAVGADCFRSYNGPAVVQLHPSFLEKLKDKKKTTHLARSPSNTALYTISLKRMYVCCEGLVNHQHP